MHQGSKDESILDAVARRRNRSEILSRLAEKRPLDSDPAAPGSPLEEVDLEEAEIQASATEKEATRIESVQPEFTAEDASEMDPLEDSFEEAIAMQIDEGILGELKKGRNDYGALGELLPQIDLQSIPITQPKRVNAKTRGEGKDSGAEDKSRGSVAKSSKRRSKKPASLLDSYFKGL